MPFAGLCAVVLRRSYAGVAFPIRYYDCKCHRMGQGVVRRPSCAPHEVGAYKSHQCEHPKYALTDIQPYILTTTPVWALFHIHLDPRMQASQKTLAFLTLTAEPQKGVEDPLLLRPQ